MIKIININKYKIILNKYDRAIIIVFLNNFDKILNSYFKKQNKKRIGNIIHNYIFIEIFKFN